MSILIATFAIPMITLARPLEPSKAVRVVQKRFLMFSIAYVLTLIYIWPRL